MRQRVLAALATLSMYRLVLIALVVLALIALGLSFSSLIEPTAVELIATFVVLAVVISASDALMQRILRLPWRVESSLVTALILLFVLSPQLTLPGLAGVAIAGIVASLSKYVIAWRGRHILNPAAVGATVITLTGFGTFSSWWIGEPALAVPTALLGLAVIWRTEKMRIVLVFFVVAVAVSLAHGLVAQESIGFALGQALGSSPILFLGAVMLSEPLTLPPRRWQQFWVAGVVGVLVGWPIPLGETFTLGAERALLIGNVVAFAFALRGSVRLVLEKRAMVTPTVQELTFRTKGRLRFLAGQYLELDVPHRHPDARGTRREFSILSAPADLPELRIAYKNSDQQNPSSYKRALAEAQPGATLAVTGTWGDFLLPHGSTPVLMVAAGIGVTPFVSQLRQLAATGSDRDVVLIYVASDASELAFHDELAATSARVVVFTKDEPHDLPAQWTWAEGARLNAENLQQCVPDLAERAAFISGPPRLIADLAPALQKARSLTTDAFAGY